MRDFWFVVEPSRKLVDGWVLDAICEHLEAVTYGEIQRLLINVPPGSMKSLLCNVFWPAWEWACGFGHTRTLSFSYAQHLTERDNEKFRDILQNMRFQLLFGRDWRHEVTREVVKGVQLTKIGSRKVGNTQRGWKFATSVGGVGTGERGDRVILDDPHNVAEGESEVIRQGTVDWFRTAMSNRLNDMEKSAIVVIMQRVHEDDVSGAILNSDLGYVHLMIPAEYDPTRHCETEIGWSDPRSVPGDIFWPERFPPRVLSRMRTTLGPYGYAGQYQQSPTPAGGGIFPRDQWKLWEDPVFPTFKYMVASLDPAYGLKDENDWSACTVWGVWYNAEGVPGAMLVRAWQERLPIHELVEKVHRTCRHMDVHRVLIENKASGMSVNQELLRLHQNEGYSVELVDPMGLDKVARAYAVQAVFFRGMIWAPERTWADLVIDQCAQFPKGKHDDLVDSAVQAIKHLRLARMLTMPEEREAELEDEMAHKGELKALYPV